MKRINKTCHYCNKKFKHYLHQYSSLNNVYACKHCGKSERRKLQLERNNEVACLSCGITHLYPKEMEAPEVCDRCVEAEKKREMEERNEIYREQEYERQLGFFMDKLNLEREELKELINFINMN